MSNVSVKNKPDCEVKLQIYHLLKLIFQAIRAKLWTLFCTALILAVPSKIFPAGRNVVTSAPTMLIVIPSHGLAVRASAS